MKKSILLLFLALVSTTLIFLSCNNNNNTNTNKIENKTVYNKILRTKTLRVGYIHYPPAFIKDPNTGEYSGIFYEVLEEVGKNLDLKIKYVQEVGWGDMIEALQSDKVDIINQQIWPTAQRGKYADFLNPIYYISVDPYVRYNDNRFDNNIELLNSKDIKIVTLDGEMTSIIAKYDFPLAQTISLPQTTNVSQLPLEVVAKKGDVTFLDNKTGKLFIKNNPNQLKKVENVDPLRIFPNCMMIKKGENNLQSMLNIAIEEVRNNGFIDKVIQKYEPLPNTYYRVALPISK